LSALSRSQAHPDLLGHLAQANLPRFTLAANERPELLDIAPRTIEQKFRSASKDDLRLMAQGLSGTRFQARSGSGQLWFTDLKVARLYGAPALLANARGKLELPGTVENMEAYYRYAVVVTRRGYWVNFCGGEPPAKVGETFQLFLEQLGVRD